MVSKKDRESNPQKIKVFVELKPPSMVKEVQRTLRHIEWYWKVIQDYAILSMFITRLIQKDVKFEWGDKCQDAFDILKEKLSTFPILRPFNWLLSFYVLCDASSVAIKSILCQTSREKDNNYLIVFFNRQLNPMEKNYITTK